MLTIDELEAACDRSQELDFSRHALELPELTFCRTFYPFGFATELRTNSTAILSLAEELWAMFETRFDRKFENRPIRVDVHVEENAPAPDPPECPPAPVPRMNMPLFLNVADAHNFSIADLAEGWTRIVLSRATERYRSYLSYFFLGAAPLCHISCAYVTPIHAACVAFNGKGVLLCGDSGAGKSSLSYACARAGATYITDDCSYLLGDGGERQVMGNCHQVRFRPSAGRLFAEIDGLEITPRAAGKPSIELPTASLPWMNCAPSTRVDSLIFLNRRTDGPQALVPYRKDVARYFLRQVVFGPAQSLARQYRALDELLHTEVLELRYQDMDWAVERLRRLAVEGR